MEKMQGLVGSKGQAFGTVLRLDTKEIKIEKQACNTYESELLDFHRAKIEYQEELEELYETTFKTLGEQAAEIFHSYQSILNDDIFFKKPIERALADQTNIAYEIMEEQKNVCNMFQKIDDEYLRERSVDIENVCRELVYKMRGVSDRIDRTNMKKDFIVIAKDLTPADTIRIDKTYLRGFVTEKGGATSHTVILAKSLGIPAIVGIKNLMEGSMEAREIYVNGDEGNILLDPDDDFLKGYFKEKIKMNEMKEKYDKMAYNQAMTADGFLVNVCTNSGDTDSIKIFNADICDGIGLFRTEFLYMNEKNYPSEEKQFEVYKNMAIKTKGKELIIRTLDIGGDKQLDYMNLPVESNPFLGYRAIRICLDREDVFLTQLRAILRASAFGQVKIMLPMIVNLEELRAAKKMIEIAMEQLKDKGLLFDKEIEVGIMIETPAAVLLSDKLAKECAFFSIGTNDLIQYTTATDRMNDKVQYLYDPCNISVLRAIYQVIQNGHKAGIKVGMCGEAASDEELIPIFLGFGLDEFSISPSQVGRFKYALHQISKVKSIDLALKILDMDTSNEVKKMLSENIEL